METINLYIDAYIQTGESEWLEKAIAALVSLGWKPKKLPTGDRKQTKNT